MSRRSVGRFDRHLGQRVERQPAIAAVDDGLQHRAEARVAVGDPVEGLAVQGAARRRCGVECLRAQLGGGRRVTAAVGPQRLGEPRHPGLRPAEHVRQRLAGKHRLAHRFALHRLAVGADHRQRAGIQLTANLQLRQGALPLAEHGEQLEQEDAQLRVRRLAAHLLLERSEGGLRIARGQKRLRVARHSVTLARSRR